MRRQSLLIAAALLAGGCPAEDAGVSSDATSSDDPTSGSAESSAAAEESSGGGIDLPAPPTTVEETIAIYGAAWNEPDPERRHALLTLSWADEGVYRDPTVLAEGRDALVEAIGAFQQALPGAGLDIVGEIDGHGPHIRFDWELTGPTPSPGMDVGEFDADFRLVRIVGFFGPQPMDAPVSPQVQAYVDAWNETDAAMRATLLAAAVTDDVAYRDPTADVSGSDALSAHIAATQEAFGAVPLALVGTPDEYDSVMRFRWALGDAAAPVATGLDSVVVAEDGRLAEITGFFDPME